MDFPIEDLEGWANDKLPVTITVQPSDIKQALGALGFALTRKNKTV